MIDQDRVKMLLGSGLDAASVSTTVGCDPSYITQLLSDDAFRGEVLTLRTEALQLQTQRDRRTDSIEDELLSKMEDTVKYLTRPHDIRSFYQTINKAVRRGAAVSAGNINITQNIVTLNLSGAARKLFTTNGQGEVVQVDDQATVTMPLQHLIRKVIKPQKEPTKELTVHGRDYSSVNAGEHNEANTRQPATFFAANSFADSEAMRIAEEAGI